jgi:hypothetical protein
MICQSCGIEAPTKHVAFYQNIGALVLRFSSSIDGDLCKPCVHKYFWKMTATNAFLGWWGVISFMVTPFFILNNVIRYLLCLAMPGVPAGARAPELTDQAIERISPHVDQLIQRLNSGEDFHRVAEEIGLRAAVTPGQVAIYVRALIAASEAQPQPAT